MAEAKGDYGHMASVLAALLAVLALTLACLLAAAQLQRILGRTGVAAIARVFGVLLAGLAVQFVLDGLREAQPFASF